jgi:hypothetical protein
VITETDIGKPKSGLLTTMADQGSDQSNGEMSGGSGSDGGMGGERRSIVLEN